MSSMKERLLEQLRHLRVEKYLTEHQRNELFRLETLLGSYNDKIDELMHEFGLHQQETQKKMLIAAASQQTSLTSMPKQDLRSLIDELRTENHRKEARLLQMTSVCSDN